MPKSHPTSQNQMMAKGGTTGWPGRGLGFSACTKVLSKQWSGNPEEANQARNQIASTSQHAI